MKDIEKTIELTRARINRMEAEVAELKIKLAHYIENKPQYLKDQAEKKIIEEWRAGLRERPSADSPLLPDNRRKPN